LIELFWSVVFIKRKFFFYNKKEFVIGFLI
jgi:hypothetical protein